MLQIGRRDQGLLSVVIVFLAAMSLPASGQIKHATGPQSQKRLTPVANRVLLQGVHGKIPPHLATLLGISREQECPVMQGVLRNGKQVQGFDVSIDHKSDIVIFVVDETANDQVLYLTSNSGLLRKMVRVKNGVGSAARITGSDRKAFEKEKEFWVTRLGPDGSGGLK